jgi:hypothetical protein
MNRMTARPRNAERDGCLRQLAADGKTQKQIAEAFGADRGRCRRRAEQRPRE